jgi:hypothetical protein
MGRAGGCIKGRYQNDLSKRRAYYSGQIKVSGFRSGRMLDRRLSLVRLLSFTNESMKFEVAHVPYEQR